MNTSFVEVLEARIAPAPVIPPMEISISDDGLSAAYTDIDGDHVTIKTTAGDLHNAVYTVAHGATAGEVQLQQIDISGVSGFAGASLTFSAKKAGGGDGLVAVGAILADNVNLAKVTVGGDLGAIVAGTGSDATALVSLAVNSMGRYGLLTQSGSPSLDSDIQGSLGALTIKGDFSAHVHVSGSSSVSIGGINIGGSVIGGPTDFDGNITSDGSIGNIVIGRDLQGGAGNNTGEISSHKNVGNININGSIFGGTGARSGRIATDSGVIGNVSVKHDVLGGGGGESGYVENDGGSIGNIKIGGSLTGGAIGETGCFVAGSGVITGNIGNITIGHDVRGGGGPVAGYFQVTGKIGNITIMGSIIGGSSGFSGGINADGDLGAIKIGHDLVGGGGSSSGFITGAKIASLQILGSVIGGTDSSTGGITSFDDMGPVKIGHNLIGSDFSHTGYITSIGQIASVTVGGSVMGGNADFSGVINTQSGLVGTENNIGSITIGHNLVGGSIDGTDGDVSESGLIESNGALGSVTIKGSIISGIDDSTAGSLDSNASIRAAYNIKSLTVNGSIIGHHTANGDSEVIISAKGLETVPANPSADPAIGNIKVGGRVERTEFLAGYNTSLLAVDGDAQIGKLQVTGDWVASSLVAGAQNSGGLGHWGDGHDSLISTPSIAKIASIQIGGIVIGDTSSTNGMDHFGFVSHAIGSFKAGGTAFTLPSSPGTLSLSPLTGDVSIVLL